MRSLLRLSQHRDGELGPNSRFSFYAGGGAGVGMLGMLLRRHDVKSAAAEVRRKNGRIFEGLFCEESLSLLPVFIGHDAPSGWAEEARRGD